MNSAMTGFRYKGEADCEPLHYDWCGLDDVYLLSGYECIPTADGDDIVIKNMDELHKAIGMHLARHKKALNGKEIRFLRHELDYSQKTLGEILGVSAQMVARYEKQETPIPEPAEMLLRLIYLSEVDPAVAVKIREMAEELRAKDDPAVSKNMFAVTEHGWELKAA